MSEVLERYRGPGGNLLPAIRTLWRFCSLEEGRSLESLLDLYWGFEKKQGHGDSEGKNDTITRYFCLLGLTLRKASLDGDNSVFHTRSPSHLKAFPSLTQAAIPQLHQFSLNVISYKGFILVPFTLLWQGMSPGGVVFRVFLWIFFFFKHNYMLLRMQGWVWLSISGDLGPLGCVACGSESQHEDGCLWKT